MSNNTLSGPKSPTKSGKITSFLLTFAPLFVMGLLLLDPATYAKSVINGLTLFFTSVLPGLLPFMFLTKLMTARASKSRFKFLEKPMQSLFGVCGIAAYPMLMSLISGYPIGSKITRDLADEIPKSQHLRVALLSSTSGPIFTIGAVGTMMLGNAKLGLIIYISNILAILLSGLVINLFCKASGKRRARRALKQPAMPIKTGINPALAQSKLTPTGQGNAAYREAIAPAPFTPCCPVKNKQPDSSITDNFAHSGTPSSSSTPSSRIEGGMSATKVKVSQKSSQNFNLMSIVSDTTQSLLVVGFYIALFSVVIDLLTNLKVISTLAIMSDKILGLFGASLGNVGLGSGIMSGIIEMTRGAKILSATISPLSVALISSIIAFGGLSIILQSLSFLSSTHLKPHQFILGKLLHSLLAFLLCLMII